MTSGATGDRSRPRERRTAGRRTGALAEAIVQTVRTPLVVLDGDLRVHLANRAFYETFAVSPGEAEGRLLHELAGGRWDISTLRVLLEETLTASTVLEDHEIESEVVDHGRRTMLVNARRVRDDSGRVPLILLSIEDITRRRATEEAQERHARELARSNAALEEFARVVSHDLQEPLRKIVSYNGRLVDAAAEVLEGRARGYLDRVVDASHRMQVLINDLLVLSRVTTRGQALDRVDLGSIAREVVADLEARIDETGGRVEIGELPVIDADPLHMRQLLQNLLGNALKYHRQGVPPVVHIAGVDDGHWAEMIVTDNGIGFEPRYAEKIFGLFQRLHRREEYDGTGAGLAICQKIAERHGGRIVARGVPGEGSAFHVTLLVNQPRPVGRPDDEE